jgi:hypothetical protein
MSNKIVHRDSNGRFSKFGPFEGACNCESRKIVPIKEELLSSKKTIYKDENGVIRKVVTEPNHIMPSCSQNDIRKEIPKEIPEGTKKYLADLSIAADVEENKIFHESLLNNLEKGVLMDKISNLRKSIIEIKEDNPLCKYGNTKEFKKAKGEFFYEIIYQVMGLRKKIFNEIKEKYGENASDAIMYIMRDSIRDIWYNCSDSDIELKEKEKVLDNEERSLAKVKERNENELSSLPKINGCIIEPKIIEPKRSDLDIIELDMGGDDLNRYSNNVNNSFMTEEDYSNMISELNIGKPREIKRK